MNEEYYVKTVTIGGFQGNDPIQHVLNMKEEYLPLRCDILLAEI
jgi:hypothetical protein